jgi:hypothetical integral membrane protein (TIGR02206 family)
MEKYFQANSTDSFVLFSLTHWLTLLVMLAVLLFFYLFRKNFREGTLNFITRISLAMILFLSEISLHLWLWRIEVWTVQYSLPFHLSSISLILSAIVLVTKSYPLFEFTYFAGVGSALQAILTPDISAYTFPHFRYVHFFISHGGIVIANIFMVFVEQYRPKLGSLWRAFLFLNLYAVFVFILNYFLEGNYMYISQKPLNPSLLDYLSPWPYYILELEAIALITFIFLYIPFWILKKRSSRI